MIKSEKPTCVECGQPCDCKHTVIAHFCSICDAAELGLSETRTPDPGELPETVITEVIPFPDGSRIRILIDVPAICDDETDQATQAYYLHLFDRLHLIEQLRQRPADSAHKGGLSIEPNRI